MVIEAPADDLDVNCGGTSMVDPKEAGEASGDVAADLSEPCLLGKRYVNAEGTLELLCVKAGKGSLSIDGTVLPLKDAKPLPSSD